MNIEVAHLDQGSRLLDIPITKTGVPRTIPLCEEALEAIEELINHKQTSPDFRADSVTQSFSRALREGPQYHGGFIDHWASFIGNAESLHPLETRESYREVGRLIG
jgi:hypothetical protein